MERNTKKSGLLKMVLCALVLLFFAHSPFAQITKDVREATKEVTAPMKETQGAAKEVSGPIKDVRRDVKTVTNAPKEVVNEAQRTEKEVEKIGKEADGAKSDVQKLTGSNKGADTKAGQDSAKAGNGDHQGHGGTVIIDERKVRDTIVESPNGGQGNNNGQNPEAVTRPAAPMYSKDGKTPSGPVPGQSNRGRTDEPSPIVQPVAPRMELIPKFEGNPVDFLQEAGDQHLRGAPFMVQDTSKLRTIKGNYSGSTAWIALEKADFEAETLEQLFKYSDWDGPDREHTIRSVSYTLEQFRMAITEIKKLDPGQSTLSYEDKWREMKAAYTAQAGNP